MIAWLKSLSPREAGLLSALAALALDQASKLFLLYGAGFIAMQPGDHIAVLPFFDLIMVWNPGVSYGLFAATSAVGRIVLELVAAGAIGGLGYWMWRSPRVPFAVGLGLVIGGAIANNLIDRPIYGRVADFFHFYGFGHDWYVFNVADIAITAGVIVILYDTLARPEPAGLDEPPQTTPGE